MVPVAAGTVVPATPTGKDMTALTRPVPFLRPGATLWIPPPTRIESNTTMLSVEAKGSATGHLGYARALTASKAKVVVE